MRKKQQVLELPDEFMLSLNFQTTGELMLMCLPDARADLSDAGMLVTFFTIKKRTDLNYHIKCYM